MAYVIHIDDNDIDRLVLTRFLKKQEGKLEIESFSNVQAAEEYLNKIGEPGIKVPDLIITDNNMPIKTGFDLVEFVRANAKLNRIPVLMLSSSILEKDIRKAYKLGVDSYLTKPINIESVQHIIELLRTLKN